MKSILVAEDDELLNAGLCYNLRKEGYEPVSAYDLEQAQSAFSTSVLTYS